MPWIGRYFYFIASLFLTGYLILVSRSILSPLLAAFILALVLNPLVKKLEKIKLPRLMSTIITVVLFVLVILILIGFFSSGVGNIDFQMGEWKSKLTLISGKLQNLMSDFFKVSEAQQTSLIDQSLTSFLKSGTTVINNTLSFTTNFISAFVLFILSLFFLLYYHRFFVSFLFQVVQTRYHSKLEKILLRIKSVVQHYIFGLSLIIIIVAFLNTMSLLILGIEHAFLFGTLAAVLTIIPYLGIAIGSLFPIIFAFATKDSLWYPFGVLCAFLFVQFLEGNFLTPNIVAKQVSINPFAAIVGLIVGGMLLGIVGIIFAVPILAMLKVICDEVPALNPVGYLLGNPKDSTTKA